MSTLDRIGVHPVKSTAIRPVASARVLPWGLAGDRRWMVVDGDRRMVSARELHALFTIRADTPATEPALAVPLRLAAEGHDPVDVMEPDTDPVPVRLHSHDLLARPADPAASQWVRRIPGPGRPHPGLVR